MNPARSRPNIVLRVGLHLALAASAFLPGCVAPIPEPAPGHAICPECRCTGDLACLDVRIGPDTPSAVVDGVTYYFCSPACRDDYLARRAKAQAAR